MYHGDDSKPFVCSPVGRDDPKRNRPLCECLSCKIRQNELLKVFSFRKEWGTLIIAVFSAGKIDNAIF